LSDGEFHSGARLAAELGVTRSAIWKSVRDLRELGAQIHSVPNRGYRLLTGVRAGAGGGGALDAATIVAALPAAVRGNLLALDVVWSLASTNSSLLESAAAVPPGLARVLLAEHQSAGRGRRGRSWLAPLGGSLCLSIGWTFAEVPREISALSLAVGVGVRRALEGLGISGIRLKWPNDLVAGDQKLGGILIELRAEAGGPGYVVVGLGLNVSLPAAQRAELVAAGTAAIDLESLGAPQPNRNLLAAAVVAELLQTLAQFGEQGFGAFAADWAVADNLRGRAVRLESPAGSTQGIARGIDADGALRVETSRGIERFLSAEVSVRAEAQPA